MQPLLQFPRQQRHSDSSWSNDNNNNNNLISLRLIPHREQMRRRARELQQSQQPQPLFDSLNSSSQRQRRRIAAASSSSSSDTSLSSSTTQVIDALYQGYGTHYVDLWCGTPVPQRQTVIVDTGSGVTAFPCLGCKNCGDDKYHIDRLYNQSASTSFQPLTCQQCMRGHCHTRRKLCQLGMTYQEGSSWSAYEVVDNCYAGGPHDFPLKASEETPGSNRNDKTMEDPSSSSLDDADPRLASSFSFPMTFGCQTHLTGLFISQLADGILGMDNANTAFWYQMYQAGKIDKQMFSLCYSRPTAVDRQGTHAGAMTLGGSDSRLHTSPMVYATMNQGDTGGWYPVHVRRAYLQVTKNPASPQPQVDIVPLQVSEEDWNTGQTIVDSGTTNTYISSISIQYWNQIWQEVTGSAYFDIDEPVELTPEALDQLPTILLQLKGDDVRNAALVENNLANLAYAIDADHPHDVIVAIPPSHYMEYNEEIDKYVATIAVVSRDEHSGNVLGANTMMGHDVLFDVENSLIGWATSDCDYSLLLQSANIVIPAAKGYDANRGNQSSSSLLPGWDTQTCDEFWTCQGPLIAGLVTVLTLGLCVGRYSGRSQNRTSPRRLHEYQLAASNTSELELSHCAVVQYRDDPTEVTTTTKATSPSSSRGGPNDAHGDDTPGGTSRNGTAHIPELS